MSERNSTNVELNRDVGYRLLGFLNGLDALAFLEAVNDSAQFNNIATTLDYHFVESMKKFIGEARVLIPQVFFHRFSQSFEIKEESLMLSPTRYYNNTSPCQRMFIHPCCGTHRFAQMCQLYRTALFQC